MDHYISFENLLCTTIFFELSIFFLGPTEMTWHDLAGLRGRRFFCATDGLVVFVWCIVVLVDQPNYYIVLLDLLVNKHVLLGPDIQYFEPYSYCRFDTYP